jgi:hypothetical protein
MYNTLSLRRTATRPEARIFWEPVPNAFVRALGMLARKIPAPGPLVVPPLALRRAP